MLAKECECDITGVGTISHQQHAQRAQVDVLLVFVGHQSPVHVSGLHTRHLGCNQERHRELAFNLSDGRGRAGQGGASDLCTGTLSGSMTVG